MRHVPHNGMQARQEAEVHLDAARSQRPAVSAVATSLRELRHRNHFAELLQFTIDEGRRR